MLNAGITPVVHEYGSLGCSGDLAPLAHCALAADGRGRRCATRGRRCCRPPTRSPRPASTPVVLRREGGPGPHQRHRRHARHAGAGRRTTCALLLRTADIAAAMSVEALLGTDAVFAADLQALRPHPGQADSAANLRALLAGLRHHGQPPRPGVHPRAGRLLAALLAAGARRRPRHARPRRDWSPRASWPAPSTTRSSRSTAGSSPTATSTARRSPTCSTSSPSSSADVASIAERRTDRFLDVARNHGLPPFLADDPGVDSGHMIAQYTQAAIVSELKRLAVPASVDSIPSCAMQEDHVSMGWSAARKLRRAVDGADPGAGDRAADGRPGARPARAAAPRPRRRRPSRRPARAASPGPAPTATWPPRSRPPSQLVAVRRGSSRPPRPSRGPLR